MSASMPMRRGAKAVEPNADSVEVTPLTSNWPFRLYLVYTATHFLSLPNWFPAIRPLRPTVVLMLAVFLVLFLNRDALKNRLNSPISKKLLVLLGYIVLSLPFVEFPGSVIKNNLDTFLKAIVFFFFTVLIVDSDKRLKGFVGLFVGCQLIRILDPVRLNITEGYLGSQTHLGHGEFAGRLSSAPWDVVNPNGYAFVIITGFFFAHYLMLGSRSLWLRLSYWAMLPVMMYALMLTMSRSGLIAMIAGLLVILVQSKRKLMLIVIACVGAVLATANMTEVQKERYESLFRSDVRGADTAAARVDGSLTELKLWLERPIFGWGVGTSAEARYHVTGNHRIAHNMYAEVLLEIGIIGFVLFASVLVAIWKNSMRALRKMKTINLRENERNYYVRLGRALQSWFFACVVFSVAHYGLSEPYWYLFAGLAAVWSHLAIIAQQKNVTEPAASQK